MSAGSEIIAAQPQALATRPSFFDLEPREKLAAAQDIATALVEVVRARGLTRNFGGEKDHVEWEGWAIMLSFLGVRTDVKAARRGPTGNWEAEVELVRIHDGGVVGRGSAICTIDEGRGKGSWGNKPDNARRSMAITRAAGKAARLNFSWIMALGGLNPTPAEEMGTDEPDLSALFDGSDEHRKYVRTELARRAIDPARWKGILDHMNNRPLSERDAVIDEQTRGQTK
jgi:hypothetical protein